MSAKIFQAKDRQENNIFPQTLTSAVFDPESGASIKAIVEAAVRDILGKMGDLSDLQTAIKSSLVDAINEARQTGGGGGGGGSVVIVDNLDSDSAIAALSANQGKVLKELLDGKQGAISDLADIKAGAEKGASSVQSIKIGGVAQPKAADGSVDLPAYPTRLPASDVYDWAKAASKPAYSANEVGALPSTTKIPTKVSDLNNDSGFVTSADIANKADKIRKGLAYPDAGFVAGIFYSLGSISGSHSWALQASTDDYAEYMISFTAGSPAPTISWPAGLSWAGGSAPEIKAGKSYQISILDNLAIAAEF